MKTKLMAALAAVALMGCTSTVTVKDGTSDQLVGEGVDTVCKVYVDKGFTGDFMYKSDACEVVITAE